MFKQITKSAFFILNPAAEYFPPNYPELKNIVLYQGYPIESDFNIYIIIYI
jgi:hypothetical protein